MLTRAGVDYEKGGFFLLDKANKPITFDADVPYGSVVSVFPSMFHGVETIDPGEPIDFTSKSGRWYLSVYSVDSHAVANRTNALTPDAAAKTPL